MAYREIPDYHSSLDPCHTTRYEMFAEKVLAGISDEVYNAHKYWFDNIPTCEKLIMKAYRDQLSVSETVIIIEEYVDGTDL